MRFGWPRLLKFGIKGVIQRTVYRHGVSTTHDIPRNRQCSQAAMYLLHLVFTMGSDIIEIGINVRIGYLHRLTAFRNTYST